MKESHKGKQWYKWLRGHMEKASKYDKIVEIVNECYETGLPKYSETLVMRLKRIIDAQDEEYPDCYDVDNSALKHRRRTP